MSGLRDKPADQQTYRQEVAKDVLTGFGRCGGESPEFLAQLALSRADALIAALEGPAATPGPTPDPGLTPTSAALKIECSFCHAAPGEPCRDPGRQVLPYATVHVARAGAAWHGAQAVGVAQVGPHPPPPQVTAPAPAEQSGLRCSARRGS